LPSPTPPRLSSGTPALGAKLLWDLGSVAGLEIQGAAFFLGQPENNGWDTPQKLGTTTLGVEVFCDNPDDVIARALKEGATPRGPTRVHNMPWGPHRQGGSWATARRSRRVRNSRHTLTALTKEVPHGTQSKERERTRSAGGPLRS
jgi:hypothetical protein